MSRVFHVIDSIKGGCGKTTFAIMLTEYLERKWKERTKNLEPERSKHACLLDVDFVGTGMIDLFFSPEKKAEFLAHNIYLTNKIRGFQAQDKRYIYPFDFYGRDFYVGFGDPDFSTKEKFRCSSKYNYTTVIGYGIFRSGMKKILEKGALEEQVKGEVASIILDMSPGMDAYSEVVKECIFDKRHSDFLEPSDKRNYYLMVGMDASHLESAKDYFLEFLKGEDKKTADHIFIVFDDVLHFFSKEEIDFHVKEETKFHINEIDQYNSRITNFCKVLKDFPEELLKKICFLALNPYEEYSALLHMQKPLNELSGISNESKEKPEIFQETPFRFAAMWDERTNDAETIETFVSKNDKEKEILEWLM